MTIDAKGTQKEIAQTILDGGADHVLALKENWPATYAEVEKVFADPPPDLALDRCETVDSDRGRIETAAMPSATPSDGCSPTAVTWANPSSLAWLTSA